MMIWDIVRFIPKTILNTDHDNWFIMIIMEYFL